MRVFEGYNVQSLFPMVIRCLSREGVKRNSRNGPVTMFPEPVSTVYTRPWERALYYPERDANPFFHLMEALWMLAGQNDVAFIAQYVERMREYSDDGHTFHGAYGHRWRRHFNSGMYEDLDQLNRIIGILRRNPDDRRCVLTMWDPEDDLGYGGKDVPCNTQATFQINHRGSLDMVVMNRSNDIIWGAYGANAVHFSVLHEYMATCIGVVQGTYTQVSANFHAYDDALDKVAGVKEMINPYYTLDENQVGTYPLMATTKEVWDRDLRAFMCTGAPYNTDLSMYEDGFFKHVAEPVRRAYYYHKQKRRGAALEEVEKIRAADWKLACYQWLMRRYKGGPK
jgi:hypothetical protein